MLTFDKFQGINNVLPPERLADQELVTAINVDIGLSGEVRRRGGFTLDTEGCHKNLWQADGYMLATCNGALTAIRPGGARTVVHPYMGQDRLWYCNLPDGRTTFSNGLICGITDGVTATGWGVPEPDGVGAFTEVAGQLFPGEYRYRLTHVRLSDGLEGGPVYAEPAQIQNGGILLTGLPVRDGFGLNVYLTSHNDDGAYLAGTALTGSFSYLGKNDALVLPCRTDHIQPAPAGIATQFWRGRVLTASGNLLHASRPNQWEHFDPLRDFKQFSAPITLVQPVDNGIYVGTTEELAFLSGTDFDGLAYAQVLRGHVVLGSGVEVRGERISLGDGGGQGKAMVCIADRILVAGFNGGNIQRLSDGRYQTDVQEVAATFREVDGIPQYVAVPQ